MKNFDYFIELQGGVVKLVPRTERAKARTPEALDFADRSSALEYVKAAERENFHFGGVDMIDPERKLVKYGYFIPNYAGQLEQRGQDWGPGDPTFEVGDVLPGGPADKIAIVEKFVTGEFAQRAGFGVMIIARVREARQADPTVN